MKGESHDSTFQSNTLDSLPHLSVGNYHEVAMKVFYSKGEHVAIFFPAKELKQALGVLKAMATYFKADFLWKAAQDLERDLTPRIAYDARYHICTNCFCEIDTRKDSFVHVDEEYIHVQCPELNPNRPI